jgi:hypothetical protein
MDRDRGRMAKKGFFSMAKALAMEQLMNIRTDLFLD